MTTDRMPERIQEAIQLAFKKHRGQYRKGTQFLYIIHPLSVMRLLLMEQAEDPTISDDVIVSGILHDTVEDTDVTLEQIEREFGLAVRSFVETASEPEELKRDPNQTKTWKERKEHTIKQLRRLDRSAKILSCCDKFDNAQSMNQDYIFVGDELWDRFNVPKEDIFWYYKQCLEAYRTGVSIAGSRVFVLLKREVEILCSH